MSVVRRPSASFSLLRFAAQLRPFLRDALALPAARAIVERGVQQREAALIGKLATCVFAPAHSPYRDLLHAAGCDRGDLEQLILTQGCDEALRTLHRHGVYVAFDEFKGRRPAIRGSQTFYFRPEDFDHPGLTTHYSSRSGGTTGRPTRVRVDLAHIAQSAPPWALWFAAHGWHDRPLIFWAAVHAGTVNSLLRFAKFGQPTERWFAPTGLEARGRRWAAALAPALVRPAGRFPRPEPLPLTEAATVGLHLVEHLRRGQRPCVNTSASGAVRISVAMQERGASLQGVSFLLRGEPLTDARRRSIEASGATAVQTYGSSEAGPVASQCPHPAAADEVHLFRDAFAVITPPGGDGSAASPLLLTALRPAAPKVLLNTEIGDQAVLETRACGCDLGAVGYSQHLRRIRSLHKLTGEGVTLAGSDLFRLLEEVLPRRCGGAVGDYQLLEEQDERGLARYRLRVDPRVGRLDEAVLRDVFLEELGRMNGAFQLMAGLWRQAGFLRVERRAPLLSARGKILPFRTLAAPGVERPASVA